MHLNWFHIVSVVLAAAFLFPIEYVEASQSLAGNVYYVSMTGDDDNDGSSARPWRTIQKAADSLSPGDTVRIQPGIYREQVEMHVSGLPNAPITFLADDGGAQQGDASVRLWGSEDSTGMTWNVLGSSECPAARFNHVPAEDYGKVFCADLSNWQENGEYIIPDIVARVNDSTGDLTSLTRAREPDEKVVTLWKHHEFWWAADGGSLAAGDGGTSRRYLFDATTDTLPEGIEEGSIRTLGDLTDGTVFMIDNVDAFYQYRRQIKGMLPTGCTANCTGIEVQTGNPTFESRPVDFDFGHWDGIGKFTKYYVEGLPQLLDTPGEWVYDTATKKIYIWSGVSPQSDHLEIARRHLGISFSAPDESIQGARYVTLDGLSIEMINLNYRYIPGAGTVERAMFNWNVMDVYHVQGALAFFSWAEMGDSSGLKLQNLRIAYSSNGIQFFQGGGGAIARDITLANNEIFNIDGAALRVSGWVGEQGQSYPAFDRFTLQGNHIYHIGYRVNDPTLDNGSGVHLENDKIHNLTVQNNLIEDTAHIGLAIEGTAPGKKSNNLLVKGNTIRGACRNGADCGGLYLWTKSKPNNGTTIVENILEDNQGWSYVMTACMAPYYISGSSSCDNRWGGPDGLYGMGFYADNTGGFAVYRNLIRNNGFTGMYLGNPTSRNGAMLLYNNVIDNAYYGIDFEEGKRFVNLQIKNNIFYNIRGAGIFAYNLKGKISIDHNLYKNEAGGAAWILDGDHLATVADVQSATRYEDHGQDYSGTIFINDPPAVWDDYAPKPDSSIVDAGDKVPDFYGVQQSVDYPSHCSPYDLGITELDQPLPELVLSSPANGQTLSLSGKSARLIWQPVYCASRYVAQTSVDGGKTWRNLRVGGLKTFVVAPRLARYRTYTWRVLAYEGSRVAVQSQEYTFRTPYPPSTPLLLMPANGSQTSLTPTFTWKAAKPAGYDFTYALRFKAAGDVREIDTGNATGFSIPASAPLLPGKKYTWQVRACNDVGLCSAWSKARRLITQ